MSTALFESLSQALDRDGTAQPVLVIDRQRLESNLESLARREMPQNLRLVVKSLPALPLLELAMDRLGTRRLMSFHRPFLVALLRHFHDVDILLGKPLPAAAVRDIIAGQPKEEYSRLNQVQWLVDSEARLVQYLAIAREFQLSLRIAVEIDVGMSRGGLDHPAALAPLLALVEDNPGHLVLSGLMGYDAHVSRAPGKRIEAAMARANTRYREFLSALPSPHELTLNGAGSPTHLQHIQDSPLNDVSLGSVLLKPTDFDLPQLADYQPACWIATPVLKRSQRVDLPFLGPLTRLASRLPGHRRDSIFIYGGRWMATPAWPPGMQASRLYGQSSNQQLMTVPADTALDVDDWAFFRPTQSEAVLLQFGNIRVVHDGQVREYWPTLQND